MEHPDRVKFEIPYVHETPLVEIDDHEDYEQSWVCDHISGVWRWFAFETPEAMLPHARSDSIQPGAVEWSVDGHLADTLEKWVADAYPLPRGNLKRNDREYIDRCLRRLQDQITEDVEALLVHDPRYHEIIRVRVNETIKSLLKATI
jgi:hypothetical protein